MSDPPAPQQDERDYDRLLLGALDHCSKRYEAAIINRFGAINSYLIVMAFLATGYFAAFNARTQFIGAIIALIGFGSAVVFALSVVAGTAYVRAAEAAMRAIEQRIAEAISIPEVQMFDFLVAGNRREPRVYHFLLVGYAGAAVVWVVAGIYALTRG